MKKGLPIIDLLLLGEYDGKATDYELPFTKLEWYGQDYKDRIARLVSEGYLACYSSEGTLNRLTIPELKEILRRNGQKLSGKKDELIARIIEKVPAENYVDGLPKIYSATAKGCRELSEHQAYIENQKMQYGFLNSEISEVESKLLAEGKLTSDAVLEELFLRNITRHGAAQDYGILRNTYLGLSQYFKKRNRMEESLRSLLSVIYYDLSGSGNNNSVESYSNLGYVFETSLWKEIDKLRTALNLTDEGLAKLFDEAVEISVKPSFSYFDVATMKKIIRDRLRGETNLLQEYELFSRRPPKKNFYMPVENTFQKNIAYTPAEEKPKKNYKIWLSMVAAVLLCFVLAGFLKVEKPAPVADNRIEISASKANPIKTSSVRYENDALQNLFLKISIATTEQELQNYIAADNLEYTNQSDSPKQTTYKIAYRKSDTYHTRSTGGDYVEVTFDEKTGKFLDAKYFNTKSSIELLMTSGVLYGHKSDGRSDSYYYLNDMKSYKGLDNAEECFSAQDALNRLRIKSEV